MRCSERRIVEEAQRGVDVQAAQKLADKVKKGGDFDLNDFRAQLSQMKNMGGLSSLMDTLPMGETLGSQSQPGTGPQFTLNTNGNGISDSISTLAAGASQVITITATVKEPSTRLMSVAATAPAIAMTAPTDRSTPPVAITRVMPSDNSMTVEPFLRMSMREPDT